MGAFLLYQNNAVLDLKSAQTTFRKKGFSAPVSFDLGTWRLLQYKKILLDHVDNFIKDGDQGLFCCGTVIYRRLGYSDSLKTLLKDFRQSTVNQDELIGHFWLLYWDGSRLTALTDQMNTLHIFVNDQRTCLSSSFLAMLSASPKPLPLNRLAVCEKLSTGYIVSPDTLVEGISQINDQLAGTFSHDKNKIAFIPHPPRPPVQLHNQGLEGSLERQVEVLKNHFSQLDNLNSEYAGELGISDGYDGRLLLACAKVFSKPLDLHTHITSKLNCHAVSKATVEKMASQMGHHLKIVPTKHILFSKQEQIENILRGNLYYFDARSGKGMGPFSETYTREYRNRILADGQRLSFNGVGGEVFRNYYGINRYWPINLRQWMNYNEYYPFAEEAISDNSLFTQMHEDRVRRISKRLNLSYSPKVSLLWIRRYYSEVQMPDCDANNNDAHNQIAYYHLPFIQPKITCEGINAHRYIGIAGSYQMALIRKLSPELAAFPTHYGYPPSGKIPLKYAVRYRLKELLPPRILNNRKKKRIPRLNKSYIDQTHLMMAQCSALQNSKEALLDAGVIKNFDISIWDNSQRATVFFIGSFLGEFSYKLKW